MDELIAYHVANSPGYQPLRHFNPVIVASLELPAARYVVHARVLVLNWDQDRQETSAGIRIRSSLTFADNPSRNFDGRSGLYFPLQCVLDLPEDDTIDLVAATYEGFWDQASMIAFTVDGLYPPL